MDMLIGCDPEFFLLSDDTGRFVPSYRAGVPGSKARPWEIPGTGVGVQVDNVMLEVTCPAVPHQFFTANWDSVSAVVQNYVGSLTTEDGDSLRLADHNEASFTESYLDCREGRMLGCSPDMGVWDFVEYNRPDISDFGSWRMAGGHLHVGIPNLEDICPTYVAVQLFESIVGTALIANGDVQSMRRNYYGQPGRFRPKPYGFEYRTPSNAWAVSGGFTSRVLRQHLQLAIDIYASWFEGGTKRVAEVYGSLPQQQLVNAITSESAGECEVIYDAMREA